MLILYTYIYLVGKSVGVADRNRIPDARVTASSFHNTDSSHNHPYYGRLHEDRRRGAWCAKTSSDRTHYLQVDLVQRSMFVLWPHKETRKKVSEPPPTKFTCPQTV